jgi:hypothetical protein
MTEKNEVRALEKDRAQEAVIGARRVVAGVETGESKRTTPNHTYAANRFLVNFTLVLLVVNEWFNIELLFCEKNPVNNSFFERMENYIWSKMMFC